MSINSKNKPTSKRALKVGVSRRGGVRTERIRFRLLWFATAAIFLVLLGKALWVQVFDQPFYGDKAIDTITAKRIEPAVRGVIYDRYGAPLALSIPLNTLSFDAMGYAQAKLQWQNRRDKLKERLELTYDDALKRYIDKQDMRFNVHVLAGMLDVPVEKILNQLEAPKDELPKSRYLPLRKLMPPDVAQKVLDKHFIGVNSKTEYRRFYPQPQPNAHLLGYMGKRVKDSAYRGRAGLELVLESRLAGVDGIIKTVRGARGFGSIDKSLVQPEVAGEDITLSIDARLQYILYRELEKSGRLHKARSASGMILDPSTGEILAVSNWPSFNTNNMDERTNQNERNRAFIDAFEPGSVMKPFTVAAALDSKLFNKDSLIKTTPGYIRVGRKTFHDHSVKSPVSLRTLIVRSSNVASIKIAQSLPKDGVTSMYRRFGMGTKTAVHFPSERSGNVSDPKDRQVLRRANITFGYSIEVTLAQLAQAYGALANGGILMPLTIYKMDEYRPFQGRSVIQKDIADSILSMMEGVVSDSDGTGKRAAISGYRVAGKTGTAKKLNPEEGGYYKDKYRAVFVGAAPASNPRFVTAIVVEDPVGEFYGGVVAAPVYAAVTKEALRLYNVPQDKPLSH